MGTIYMRTSAVEKLIADQIFSQLGTHVHRNITIAEQRLGLKLR
jgi:hypothetical protein